VMGILFSIGGTRPRRARGSIRRDTGPNCWDGTPSQRARSSDKVAEPAILSLCAPASLVGTGLIGGTGQNRWDARDFGTLSSRH
jgi:hypothetical protein